MAFSKYILPALAVAGSALAQSSSSSDQCTGNPSINVQNQGDATALGSCSTVTGDIVIAQQAAGSISLDGVERITGSLTVDGASNLTSLSGAQLSEIGRTFGLNGLTILSTLNFPSLVAVDTISWIALPALQSLSFEQGVQKSSNVTISNTGLGSLSGIELMTVGDIDINNNNALSDVNVNNLANITGNLNFAANSKDLKIEFPNLQFALNMTFRNLSSVSLPSLSGINGSLGFYGNVLQSFVAPNLTQTGQDIVFDDNSGLTNLSLPSLKTVSGGVQVANNSHLSVINSFPLLQNVGGAIDFSGSFKNASLPSLKDGRGGCNLQTTAPFDCTPWQQFHTNNTIHGNLVCAGAQQNPGTAGTKPTGTGVASGSSPSSTKKAAAGRFEVNVAMVMGVASVAGGLLHLSL